jgi:ABC-2 type transport system permease protein
MAFVRKELAEILRQPRLLVLSVFGPFVLLLLFGVGYSEQQVQLRTMFVGPADSMYEEVVDRYAEELTAFVDPAGFVSDEGAAMARLRDGDVDVVVVFPADPVETVLGGERAVIRVVHDEIDPIRRAAIEVSSRLAIQEVNATVLSTVAGGAQDRLAPVGELADEVAAAADEMEAAASSELGEEARARLATTLDDVDAVLGGTTTVLARLDEPTASDGGATGYDASAVGSADAAVGELRDRLASLDPTSPDEVSAAADEARELAETLSTVSTLDPEVLVRPFESETDSVLPRPIGPRDYFTPASLSLLLQHLALTFAALSLVRDRRTGLFELLRIGPLSSFEIVIGKCLAFLVVSAVVATALVGAAVVGLDVPMEGEVAWLVAMVLGVVLSSLALGMALSMLARSESQAVQLAMLSLLAGLFFSGFVLGLDDLAYPVKVISWLLPVTYGIRAFQDVMLRGVAPATADVIGVAALTVGYGAVAVTALRRRLRHA